MDKKKVVKLIVSFLILGLAIGGYVWMDSYTAKNNGDEKDTSKVLIDIGDDEITEMTYTCDDKKIKLKLDTKKDKWYNVNHKDWPIDQTYTETMINELHQVYATRTLETKEKPAEYNLDKPKKIITFKTKGKEEYTINLGRTSSGYGTYCTIDNGKRVYTVGEGLYDAFNHNDKVILEVETLPEISSNLVYYVEAKGDDFNMEAEYDGEITEIDSGEWVLKKPYKTKVRGMLSSFSEYFVNMENYVFNECVDINCKKLSKYGLDKPKLSLKLKFKVELDKDENEDSKKKAKYEKEEITILIGDEIIEKYTDENGNPGENITGYYSMIKGEDRIYKVDTTTATNILNGKAINFIYNAVNNAELTEYKDLKIKIGKKKYTIKKTRKEDKNGNVTVKYMFNDKKVDESKGDEMYIGMTELVYVKEKGNKKIKKDKTIAEFEYNGKKGGEKDTTIKFLNYDDNYYRVNKDGIEYFLVSKIDVDNLLDDIQKFAENNK